MVAQPEKGKLFDQIFTEHGEDLRSFARKNTDSNSREDLEQEILMQIWMGLHGYKGRSSLKTWAYTIARRTVKKFNRTRKRAEKGSPVLAMAITSTDTAEHTERVYILERFKRTLDKLDQKILSMYLDNRRYQEISKATGLDECALRMRVYRLKYQLSRYAGNKYGSRTAQDQRTGL